MAEQDLELTVGINASPVVAEMNRIIALMRDQMTSVNLAQPFDQGAQAARRAVTDFRAVDLSLVNISKSAKAVGDQYAQQQAQLRRVEAAIQTIRQLPVTSQTQFDSLRQLEAIQIRLSKNTEKSPISADRFAGVETAIQRFVLELKNVERASLQVMEVGRLMRNSLAARFAPDPSFIQTLANYREQIQLTGALSRSVFADLRRGAESVIAGQNSATQSAKDYTEALRGERAAAVQIVQGEEAMKRSILSRAAAAEKAAGDYDRFLSQQQRLLANIAKLSGAAAGMPGRQEDLLQRVAALNLGSGAATDPRALNELVRAYFSLKTAIEGVTGAQKAQREQYVMVTRAEQEAAAAFRIRAAAREKADQDYERALIRQYNLLRQLSKLPDTPQRADLITRVGAAVGPTEDPRALNALNKEFLALKGTATEAGDAVAGSGKKAAQAIPLYEQLGKRIASLTQYVIAAGVAYGGFQAIQAVVSHVVELDAAMHRISATISDHNEAVRVLPQAYALIRTAMTEYGLSTADAGKLTTELTRSLNGNMQEVKSAFLPALALTVRGEVDMAEASRGLIGTVNAFGNELVGAGSKLEAYAVVSDKILKASDQSVGSIGSLTQALNNVASRAALAGVTFSETISLLSLLQDNLGAAGRSGTGLTRVFEGLILNTEKAAKLFGVAFDPAKPVKAFEVLSQVVTKLRSELELTGGLTSAIANEFQVLIGTEQGTKQLELLIRAWPELAKRIKESTESGGRHMKELEEHASQLGVSFTRMANQALTSIDRIINGFAMMGGGPGGIPGQFTGLAKVFVDIGNSLEAMGTSVENTGRKIGEFVNAVKNFSLPDWLNGILTATGVVRKTNIAQATEDVGLLGQALSLLPEPPEWLKQMLRKTAFTAAGAGFGAAVSGPAAPLGALAGGAAAWMAFDFTQWGLDAAAARKELEALTKASAALQAQRGGERASETYKSPEEKAADALALVEATRLRILKERAPLVAEMDEKIRSQIMMANQDLAIQVRIAEAQRIAAASRKAANEADKEFQSGKNLDTRLTSEAAVKLAQLKQKQAQDEIAVNNLLSTLQKNRLADQKESIKLDEQRLAILERLTAERQKAFASPTTPLQDLTMDQARVDIARKVKAVAKEVGGIFYGEFAMQTEGLITDTVIAELTSKQQAIVDAFVAPYRTAAEQAIAELDKVIEKSEYLLRQPAIRSTEQRAEISAAPQRAIDKSLGIPEAERELKSLTATFAQFGEEAAAAAFAASKDFASFADMIVAADSDAMNFTSRGLRGMINGFLQLRKTLQETDLQRVKNEIVATAQAIEASFDAGGDPALIIAGNAALNTRKKTLNELATSANFAEREYAAFLVTSAKQVVTKGNVEQLTVQLANLKKTNDGIIASFGQTGAAALATQAAFNLEGVSVDKLSERMRQLVTDIAAATQKQKELADTGGLIAIGFSPEQAAAMAAALAGHDELNKKIDEGTAALERYRNMGDAAIIRQVENLTKANNRAEIAFQRQLELVKQTAQSTDDYFTFFTASFSQAATQGHTFFNDLESLAKTTATNMQSAFSDIFFATLTGNIKDAQAAFKNFMLSILREISNVMASQAVKGLLSLFGIKGGGGGLDLSGLFGGGNTQPGGAPDPTPFALAGPTNTGGTGFMNSAGFAPGEAGGDPFSSVKFGQAATTLLDTASSMSKSAGVWSAISSGWAAGEGLFGGIAGAATQGFKAMEVAFSGMTALVSYAAAVVQGVLIIMDENKSDLGKGIQTATLLAGGILAPWTAGISLIVAGLINWIEDLFGLFDKGISAYTQKRIDAGEQANRGMKSVTEGYQRATTSGDPNTVLQSLRAKSEGIGTILLATPELAARLGLDVSKTGTQEGKFEVSWDDVTLSQFQELLRVLGRDEATAEGMVGGRAFVGYLPQEQVEAVQKQMSEIAIAMLKAFVAFNKVREEVNQLVVDIQDVVEDFLPPDLAAAFKKNLLDPIRQQIIDAVQSGMPLADVTARLGNLKATLGAYVNLVTLYGQLTQDFAAYSGDFVNSMDYVDKQIKQSRENANKRIVTAAKDVGLGADLVDPTSGNLLNVTDAIEKVKKAFAEMDLTPVLAFEKLGELRAAVIERFELEKKLVTEAEASIAKLYSEHVSGIAALYTSIEQMNTAITGSDTGLNSMIQTLIRIGTTSLSVSESLWAVNTALDIFIKTLPNRIAGKAGRPDDPTLGAGALPVDQILPTVLGVVGPFAQTLNREIRNAFDAGDFETAFHLLQQLGAGLKSAMDAAIAGVRQWEAAQIAVINNEADRRIREAGKVRDMYQKQLDKERELVEEKLDAIRKQKDAIQDQKWAIEDTIQSIRDQMRPLEDQIKAITRQQELLRRSMRPIDAAIRAIGDLMRPIQAQLDALDDRAELAQQIADDQLWNISLQTYALEQQRDTIQEEIDLIEEMANAVLSVRDYLLDLALSQQAPPDAIGQFQIAQSSFDQLFAAYQADPTAEGLIELQEAAQRLFGALGPLFERPSAEYRALYEEIVKKLEAAAAMGANIADPARLEDLVDQLELVDQQLEDLNDAADLISHNLELELHAIELLKRPLEDQLKQYQDQIDALNLIKDRIQRQIDLLEEQKEPIQDLLDLGQDHIDALNLQLEKLGRAEELLGRTETTLNRDLARIADNQDILNQLYQDYVDSINTLRDEAIDATEAAADAIVASIEKEMMPLMTAVGWDAHHFYEWMRNEQYARLMDLTSGQGTAAWMRTAQQNTADWIGAIRAALDTFLMGDMKTVVASIQDKSVEERMIETLTNLDGSIGTLNNYLVTHGANPPVPAATPAPGDSPGGGDGGGDGGSGLAEGAWNVAPGTYQLHANEMVVPSAQAEALRASASGWEGISRLANGGGGMSITIAPVIHSNQNPAAIANQVVDRIIVDIRGGGAIQDAIARMPKRSR